MGEAPVVVSSRDRGTITITNLSAIHSRAKTH